MPHALVVGYIPTQSHVKFNEIFEKNHLVIGCHWTKKFYKGGSRLPKALNKDHMKLHVYDLVVRLYRVKGSPELYVFEDWMSYFIDTILDGKQYFDWAKVIAGSLRNQLELA